MVVHWSKLVVVALFVLGTASCRTPRPQSSAEATNPIVVDPGPRAPSIEPFEIVLVQRGASSTNPVYDFTVRSDGTTTFRYWKYEKGTQNLFQQRAPPEALEKLRDVLASSRLLREDGVYGGDAGGRSSARFHDSSRAIDLHTPTEHRRISFPRPFASAQYSENDLDVYTAFLELWHAAERCVPDADAPPWRWW